MSQVKQQRMCVTIYSLAQLRDELSLKYLSVIKTRVVPSIHNIQNSLPFYGLQRKLLSRNLYLTARL